MRKLIHPVTGKTFRLGRNRPAQRPSTMLGAYLLPALPTPPASADYTQKGGAFLRNVLGNDVSGCCTCSGAFHVDGAMLANADQPIPLTPAQCRALYMKLSGWNGVEDDPSDTGLDEQTVLNFWRDSGLLPDGSRKILGWVGVDGSNPAQARAALWLCDNLYFGVELPNEWLDHMPSGDGFVWDVAGDADPDNGHCFAGLGYDAGGVIVDSWGLIGRITWSAVAKYAARSDGGELYVALSEDAISKTTQRAPSGFDWGQLQADLVSL